MKRGFSLAFCTTVALVSAVPARASTERLTCAFRGQTEKCHTTICVNDPKVYIGDSPPILTVDYARGTALLNGIRGRVFPLARQNKTTVVWDLHILGTQELVRREDPSGTYLTLIGADGEAGFACLPMIDGRPKPASR
jgi:hypothetical protein